MFQNALQRNWRGRDLEDRSLTALPGGFFLFTKPIGHIFFCLLETGQLSKWRRQPADEFTTSAAYWLASQRAQENVTANFDLSSIVGLFALFIATRFVLRLFLFFSLRSAGPVPVDCPAVSVTALLGFLFSFVPSFAPCSALLYASLRILFFFRTQYFIGTRQDQVLFYVIAKGQSKKRLNVFLRHFDLPSALFICFPLFSLSAGKCVLFSTLSTSNQFLT